MVARRRRCGAGAALGRALRRFWHVRGYFDEGRRWLEQALAKDSRASASARAKALDAVGGLAHDQGDIDRAEAAAQEGLELSAQADIESGRVASFRRTLGITAEREGDYERATELHGQSLALYREAEDRWGIAASLLSLGNVLVVREEHERAKELYHEALSSPGSRATRTSLLLAWPIWATSTCSKATTSRRRRSTKKRRGCTGIEGPGRPSCMLWITWRGRRSCVGTTSELGFCMETLALCRELGDKLIGSESLEGLACAAAAREKPSVRRGYSAPPRP